jgi:hypothetical protein
VHPRIAIAKNLRVETIRPSWIVHLQRETHPFFGESGLLRSCPELAEAESAHVQNIYCAVQVTFWVVLTSNTSLRLVSVEFCIGGVPGREQTKVDGVPGIWMGKDLLP